MNSLPKTSHISWHKTKRQKQTIQSIIDLNTSYEQCGGPFPGDEIDGWFLSLRSFIERLGVVPPEHGENILVAPSEVPPVDLKQRREI